MLFYQVTRSIEANEVDFKLKQLEIKFFEDDCDAVDCLIDWTEQYPTQIVFMEYRRHNNGNS